MSYAPLRFNADLVASIFYIAEWRLLVTVYKIHLHAFSWNASLKKSMVPVRSFQVKLREMRSTQSPYELRLKAGRKSSAKSSKTFFVRQQIVRGQQGACGRGLG